MLARGNGFGTWVALGLVVAFGLALTAGGQVPAGGILPTAPAVMEVIPASGGPHHTAIVYEPTSRSLCVYHINLTSGEIQLRSARHVGYDQQILDLNSSKPTPAEIRDKLQQP